MGGVEFAECEQAGIGGDGGAAEFELQAAVKGAPRPLRFTHRVAVWGAQTHPHRDGLHAGNHERRKALDVPSGQGLRKTDHAGSRAPKYLRHDECRDQISTGARGLRAQGLS